jgi:hypothetical protein
MAKKTRSDELFERLRAQGLRKRTAKLISQATDGRRRPAKTVQRTLSDLKQLIAETEDRITGGPAKRKAAAKKAANTRRRNAQRRSTSAKKAARTRAKPR